MNLFGLVCVFKVTYLVWCVCVFKVTYLVWCVFLGEHCPGPQCGTYLVWCVVGELIWFGVFR